ncbi:uncharacterized protein LOC110038859 [Phalaenopsis equestris]|uniref:uncharacterized protein LOC110038859 n=1 Tax=Phalaenopsis equestris TaxID=78828 RepID=UPI0009E428BD|nr:uncharacterized protein LOC110038859 [Phalaenopsis equestris]
MPSGEKQPPLSAKKVSLRDLPSEINNFASNPLDFSPHNDGESISETAKLSGSKREQPCSPSTHPQQHSIYSGHLVYVRRKLDVEPSKLSIENVESADPPCLSNYWKEQSSETKSPKEEETKLSGSSTRFSSPSSFISPLRPEPLPGSWKPGNLITNHNIVSPATETETHSQGEGYWKERFVRLQTFLKNCDQSNQEKYIQSLRSLSAAGRSKHAVELERRAIQLLLDEGIPSYNILISLLCCLFCFNFFHIFWLRSLTYYLSESN